MDRWQAMRVFCGVVDAQGFTAAQDRLGMTHSTASRHVKWLESELGTQLLQRNSRGLSLTDAGRSYYQSCVQLLEQLDAAEAALAQRRARVAGVLRITLPLAVGAIELGDWLPEFEQQFPDLELQLLCTDRLVDLVAEGVDAAVRISRQLPDSGLQARLLTHSPLVLVASPAYLMRQGVVQAPGQLAEHRALAFAAGPAPLRWSVVSGQGAVTEVQPHTALRTDSVATIFEAARAGRGIAALTWHTVRSAVERGQLVRVLPCFHLGQYSYHALYPRTRHLRPAVRAFVDFMARRYRQGPGG
ncbi:MULTISPECIES: LysR family transcriptional regulator [Delftia]|uniref:LysR family transcriptional regulator n=1 Tax=Chryseobacterium sp. B5 TaxID=2050562 RepID=A0A2G7T1S1_9FLAO|nr:MULTISPECIES: LysR family transcriptional regulator [Delftia]OBY87283.1 LysR family transcriptional regulator [Delftia sp. JD2]PJO36136.1 LysR family transcriptional regulator [Delftia acidovorans]SOE35492.1 transcriptional regulator, LysR family [Delftia acidovorans]